MYYTRKKKRKELEIIAQQKTQKEKEYYDIFCQELVAKGFTTSNRFHFGDCTLFLDIKNKCWTVREPNDNYLSIYKYTDIVDFSVFEDEQIEGKQTTGGVLARSFATGFGPHSFAGIDEVVKISCGLSIKIRVLDNNKPERLLSVFGKMEKNSEAYKSRIEQCEQIISVLSLIKNEKEMAVQRALNMPQDSVEDKIRQLSNLRNDGIISEIEYEKKKKDLIDRL